MNEMEKYFKLKRAKDFPHTILTTKQILFIGLLGLGFLYTLKEIFKDFL